MADQLHQRDLDRLAHAFAPAIDDHLNYYQLAGLVDDTLSADDRSLAEDHLDKCVTCRDEFASLQAFASPGDTKPTAAPTLGERLAALGWMPLSAAAAAVLIMAAGIVWYTSREPGSQGQLSTQAQPTPFQTLSPGNNAPDEVVTADNEETERSPELALKLVDGARSVGLDGTGALVGYEELTPSQRKAVESALRSGTIIFAPELRDLQSPHAALMGPSDEQQNARFDLIGPTGKVIMTARPRLSWRPLAGSTGYRVDVFDTNYNKVASSDLTTSRSWSPSLRAGTTYIWQVTAIRDGKEVLSPVRPEPEARFHILDEGKQNDIAQLRSRSAKSHLPLALAYARAGLIDEAKREAQLFAKQNPGSNIATKLLTQLQKYR